MRARTAARSSRRPEKRRGSVSTLTTAAPPDAYAAARVGRVGDGGEVALAGAGPLDLGDDGEAGSGPQGGLGVEGGPARRWSAPPARSTWGQGTRCIRGSRSARTPRTMSSRTVGARRAVDTRQGYVPGVGSARTPLAAHPGRRAAASGPRQGRQVGGQRQGGDVAPDREHEQDHEQDRPTPVRDARPEPSSPRAAATSDREPHRRTTTGSRATTTTLKDRRPRTSPWLSAATQRSPPQNGHHNPVAACSGQASSPPGATAYPPVAWSRAAATATTTTPAAWTPTARVRARSAVPGVGWSGAVAVVVLSPWAP